MEPTHRSKELGKYQLVAEIARGGMGIVYLAIATGPARFSKLLVVKELKPEFVEDPAFTEMFLEEARLAARLNHPNILATYEIGVDGKRHFMVMDYLEGVGLARILRRKTPTFTLPMHLRVICETLQGLHYAHTLKDFADTPLGMVHRDVSPQNVFVTYDGTAKLVDFGIAKAFDSVVETRTGMLKGKPTYMAPEQLRGNADPRADLYSIGVMIWEAITGHRMWRGKGDLEILTSLVQGVIPSLKEAAPDAPPELARICLKALALDREDRYATALDLQNELEAYLKATGDASMRDVALVVCEIFKQEREETRRTVENHLNQLKDGDGPDQIPNLPAYSAETVMTPATGPSASRPSATQAAYAETSGANAAPAPPPAKGRLFAGGAAALSAVALAFVLGSRSNETAVASQAPPSAPPPVVATQAPVPASPPAAPPAVNEAPVLARTAPSTSPQPVAVEEHKVETKPRYVWTPHYNPPPKRPVAAPAVAVNVSSNSQAEPAAVEPETGTGYLTIDTYPWTTVTIGGRSIGSTPLVHVAVPAGTHTINLDNPDEKVHQSTVVTIKAGETVSRRLAF